MLMAKSCHDLDWLQHILGRAPLRVSSFGSLTHFTAANRPPGAADRCVACSVEPDCPYSAPRLYRGLLDRGARGWPLSVVIDDFSAEALDADEALDEALRTGPYGRCVYACDNDAVDHQVVTLEFPGATTAAFTMTAFTRPGHRRTRLFGTRAELTGDGETIRVYDFLTRTERTVTPAPEGGMNAGEGHGGGDAGLMDAFTAAVATGRRELISSGPRESLASHLAVFAAERARRNGTVETIPP
jgi:predicted dehydrogenase